MAEGIFVKNTSNPSDIAVKVFVRADTWFFYDDTYHVFKTSDRFWVHQDLSLAAPLLLGRWYD